jgi:hypothetical protein
MNDTSGEVTEETVEKYYGGRVEATAFKVADAALAGRAGAALSMLRHALATGVDPVPLVAALAMKVLSSTPKRPRDLGDIQAMLKAAPGFNEERVIELLQLITERGYSRVQDVADKWRKIRGLSGDQWG